MDGAYQACSLEMEPTDMMVVGLQLLASPTDTAMVLLCKIRLPGMGPNLSQ